MALCIAEKFMEESAGKNKFRDSEFEFPQRHSRFLEFDFI